MYLAIAISVHVDIVCEKVTNIAENIRAIDCQLNKFKDSLSKIKDELAFLRRSIIALIYNAGLLDIK